MIDWSQVNHFYPYEFDGEPDPEMIKMLDRAREIAGKPFILTSTIRNKGGTSAHETGHAVDIACNNPRLRFHILYGLIQAGFTRIGVYDKHIHADNSETHDQDVCWIGKSK